MCLYVVLKNMNAQFTKIVQEDREGIKDTQQAEKVEVRVSGVDGSDDDTESDVSVEEEDYLLYLSSTPIKQGSTRGIKRPDRPSDDLD